MAEVLGDGSDDLGRLQVRSVVTFDGEPVFPMPLHVLGREPSPSDRGEGPDWQPATRIGLGDRLATDVGETEFPQRENGAFEGQDATEDLTLRPPTDVWCRPQGLEAVLAGGMPDPGHLLSAGAVVTLETRVGIERSHETRTAREGQLYTAVHLRMKDGAALGVDCWGVPESWALPVGEVITLGGESRLADVSRWETSSVKMPLDAIGESCVVVLLTPTLIDVAIGSGIEGLDGVRVISGIVPWPQRIGGWDSSKREPAEARSCLAAGSVLYCRVEDTAALRVSIESHASPMLGLPAIGDQTAKGFGLAAVGVA